MERLLTDGVLEHLVRGESIGKMERLLTDGVLEHW
jgi:hypothetical protein